MTSKHHDHKLPPTYTTLSACPPTPEKKGDRQFKHRLEIFEKQLKDRQSSTNPLSNHKPIFAGKENVKKPAPLLPGPNFLHSNQSESLLALYEEAPFRGEINGIPGELIDPNDNSRANLVRLCKIAYEKGRKDGMVDERKKIREEGYRQGFKDGQIEGREEGWKEGYREGYDEGYMKGRDYGDKKIEKEINETIAELTKNPNALLSSSKVSPHPDATNKNMINMI
ncbi:hypothetical protein TWF696_004295 [Orbilia brochopaga]|uniref:Essential protein Yae1 N-terminal domain-containing protein n=1 Tax=Orbilia brochopaga TaxID=3140254 RepID=A0AAV9V5P6_9PEZI